MRYLLLGLFLLLPGLLHAQSVLDPAVAAKLGPAAQAGYMDFLRSNLPRAFAIGSGSAYGFFGGGGTIEAARTQALERCAARGATGCALFAENLDVVWPAFPSRAAPPPGALLSNWNYEAVPDNRYVWRGPGVAAGVYVWAHGFGALNGTGALADARGLQPQPHVRAFNNAGFDVVRFDRHPNADGDRDRVGRWLQDVLVELRRQGYRKIVVGGQSRGAWNALQMLRTPGLADVVVAVSAAAHGSGSSTNLSAQYDDLRQMVAEIPAAPTRLAFVQFAADPFAGDLARRAALIEQLRPRLGGLLILDQPDGFSGHGGGVSALFARRYGDCLLRFATAATPPHTCD